MNFSSLDRPDCTRIQTHFPILKSAPINFEPVLVLDIRMQILTDRKYMSDNSSFICNACQSQLFHRCLKREISQKFVEPPRHERSIPDFVNVDVNIDSEYFIMESPCERIFYSLKEGLPLPEGVRIEFHIFLVFVEILKQNIKQKGWVGDLNFLTDRYKLWLLAKFKKNLNDLMIDSGMKAFSNEKLVALRTFCRYENILFKNLHLRSHLPPTQVYRNSYKKKENGKDGPRRGRAHKKTNDNKKTSGPKKRTRITKKSRVKSITVSSVTPKDSISVEKTPVYTKVVNHVLKRDEKFNYPKEARSTSEDPQYNSAQNMQIPFSKGSLRTEGGFQRETQNSNKAAQPKQFKEESLKLEGYNFSEQIENDSHYTPSNFLRQQEKYNSDTIKQEDSQQTQIKKEAHVIIQNPSRHPKSNLKVSKNKINSQTPETLDMRIQLETTSTKPKIKSEFLENFKHERDFQPKNGNLETDKVYYLKMEDRRISSPVKTKPAKAAKLETEKIYSEQVTNVWPPNVGFLDESIELSPEEVQEKVKGVNLIVNTLIKDLENMRQEVQKGERYLAKNGKKFSYLEDLENCL